MKNNNHFGSVSISYQQPNNYVNTQSLQSTKNRNLQIQNMQNYNNQYKDKDLLVSPNSNFKIPNFKPLKRTQSPTAQRIIRRSEAYNLLKQQLNMNDRQQSQSNCHLNNNNKYDIEYDQGSINKGIFGKWC